ncbi:MAG TPA: stage III sporulation protein AF [Clostridium sp.]|jgi:stage III sporulation protein AF|nr:stage III sporulation protein AF [Clostridium sp.]
MVFLKEWILNIVTLSIFIILIEILIPSGKIKKVVNLVTGFILVIALINPILSLFKMDIDLENFQIQSSNFISSKEISINSDVLKENQIKLMTEVYREKIIEQFVSLAEEVDKVKDVEADVIINEDYNSDNFGEVERVYLHLAIDEEKNNNIKPVLSVKKIRIGKNANLQDEEAAHDKKDPEIEKQIKEKIHELFKIQKENIIISFEDKGRL